MEAQIHLIIKQKESFEAEVRMLKSQNKDKTKEFREKMDQKSQQVNRLRIEKKQVEIKNSILEEKLQKAQ